MLCSKIRLILYTVTTCVLVACGSSGGDNSTVTPSAAIVGMAINGNTLYVANADKQVIQALDVNTLIVTTLAGSVGVIGTANGPLAAARFYEPFALTFIQGVLGAPDMLYVADTYNHGIRAVNISTQVVTTLSGTLGAYGATDGSSSTALFNTPKGIANNGASIFVADSGNYLIRTVNKTNGSVGTPIGTIGQSGYVNGNGLGVKFGNPFAVAATSTYVYVSDSSNNSIRSVQISDGTVATLAGSTSGTSGTTDNATAGQGTAARFNAPAGIATDGVNVFVADSGNHTIRKIVIATGVVSTIAGTAGTAGSADGTGSAAKFNNPIGLELDVVNGLLYVTDQNYKKIRVIDLSNNRVTTLNASF